MTWTTQGREEGRWVSVNNDCCCEDSEAGADYSDDLTTQPRSSSSICNERSIVRVKGANFLLRCGGGEEEDLFNPFYCRCSVKQDGKPAKFDKCQIK